MIPQKLKQGDVIGIFSPSTPVTANNPKRYERGKHFLQSKGFRVLEGSLTGKKDFYRSGTIMERANELNELIRNKEVRCIMSSIGGLNSNSLLPYIDYQALLNDPKIIIGYSDVTAILLGVYARTKITTYYGPAAAASFGEYPPFVNQTYRYFAGLLLENTVLPKTLICPKYWSDEYIDWNAQTRSKNKNRNRLITVQGGKAYGTLIGGNLNTMMGIWGTPYMPEIKDGDILFIEDTEKDAAIIERSFSLLKLSGVFDRIGGIILGKHKAFDDQGTGRKPYEILQEVMGDTEVPFLAEYDCCHTDPIMTLPIGAEVELDADEQRVTIL